MTHVIRQKFLDPGTAAGIRALMWQAHLFTPATVTGDPSWRSGMTAHIEGRPEAEAVAKAMMRVVPAVCRELNIDIFVPSRCEVQLSSYGDGDKFQPHTDDGSPDAAERVLSWVIYMDLMLPRRWRGGELWLAPDFVFQPEDGDAIFFPSSALHEVRPVISFGTSWEARRHTVNGWLRK